MAPLLICSNRSKSVCWGPGAVSSTPVGVSQEQSSEGEPPPSIGCFFWCSPGYVWISWQQCCSWCASCQPVLLSPSPRGSCQFVLQPVCLCSGLPWLGYRTLDLALLNFLRFVVRCWPLLTIRTSHLCLDWSPRWWRDWSTSPVKRGLMSWDCSACRRLRSDIKNVSKYLKGENSEDKMKLSLVMSSARTRGSIWASGSTSVLCRWWSIGTGCPEILCRLLLGDLQKPSKCVARQPALDGCTEARIGPGDLQRSLPTQAMLWFCGHSLYCPLQGSVFFHLRTKSEFKFLSYSYKMPLHLCFRSHKTTYYWLFFFNIVRIYYFLLKWNKRQMKGTNTTGLRVKSEKSFKGLPNLKWKC